MPMHWSPLEQAPQRIASPHPSVAEPQLSPAGQVVLGVQPHMFGLLGVPPPHVCGAVQLPQLIIPPQPSETVPQLSPAGPVVLGVQLEQTSSCDGVADCWHVPPPEAQVLLVAVHCSQPPNNLCPYRPQRMPPWKRC